MEHRSDATGLLCEKRSPHNAERRDRSLTLKRREAPKLSRRILMHKGIKGAALATAVALMFVGSAFAADSSSSDASSAQVKCVGGNSCKGQSACKSASSSCKGQNACKGKGFVMSSSEKDCTAAGGKVEK
jgi:hypothetical protein